MPTVVHTMVVASDLVGHVNVLRVGTSEELPGHKVFALYAIGIFFGALTFRKNPPNGFDV